MTFNNGRPKPRQALTVPQHVIEEYSHRAQMVRCVCGWRGSSSTSHGGPSAWTRHVAEMRAPKTD